MPAQFRLAPRRPQRHDSRQLLYSISSTEKATSHSLRSNIGMGVPLGQLRKSENESERAESWKTHKIQKGKTTGY
jgi:hypothetical protein